MSYYRLLGFEKEPFSTSPDPNFLYLSREYDLALAAFTKVVENYSELELAAISQYAIGYIYETRLKDASKARNAYEEVIKAYPDTYEAHSALRKLSNLGQ